MGNSPPTPREIFSVFLRLGLTSFGGPLAHLGYFHREFVVRRRWLTEPQFAQLLAICQTLPGPASSQLGFAIGLLSAGWRGAIAAFIAFTTPSAVLLLGFAYLLPHLSPAWSAPLHGLTIVAFVVVLRGLFSMIPALCPDLPRLLLAALSATIVSMVSTTWIQTLVIIASGLFGLLFLKRKVPLSESTPFLPGRLCVSSLCLLLFGALLMLPALDTTGHSAITLFNTFYHAGALVFGGGHVVLPLLESSVVDPGLISRQEFLAGYGAAQAVPGPMFSFAAFLGARIPILSYSAPSAAIALIAIFTPGFLLLCAALPIWNSLAFSNRAAHAIAGMNAGVVGLLVAALYDPLFTEAIRGASDVLIASIGFALMVALRIPALGLVIWCAGVKTLYALLLPA